MQIDARTVPNGQIVEADLGIVGAGPAGLTLARECAGWGLQVALLESGGLRPDAATQALCGGTTLGDPYAGPLVTRHRQAGGTVHIWNTPIGGKMGAKYVPLDAIDFTERPWLPLSGWPLALTDLDWYYPRAHGVCGLGPYTYEAADWATPGCAPLPLRTSLLTPRVYQFGDGRVFTQTSLAELARARNVQLYLHATAVELQTDPAGEWVTHARVRCLTGAEFRLRARVFVLATGGIENARLLLLSARAQGGLGNRHDLVGRCFMEHPRDGSCALLPRDPAVFEWLAFYAMHTTPRGTVMGRWALSEEAMEREHLLNMSVTLLCRPRGTRPFVKRVLRRFGGGALRRLRREPLRLLLNLEQAPDPANRIQLGPTLDALGQPRVQVVWHWREADQRNLVRLHSALAGALEDAGLGLFVSTPSASPDPNGHHHLGTTRMHRDPRQGVVDEHSRVHGTANLFVAGSSVFPTGGYANPTLTIVALSLRLADHLKGLFTGGRLDPATIATPGDRLDMASIPPSRPRAAGVQS
jgi:choline dehydrogenase-like flavoprotein